MLEDRLYFLLDIYHTLPCYIKRIVGYSYNLLPKSMRYGEFYSGYKNRIQDFKRLTADQKEQRIKSLLFKQVNYAIDSIDFYKDLSKIESYDEFRRLPIVNKNIINNNRGEFISREGKNLRLKANTGGSSGTPFTFYLHKGVTRSKEKAHFDDYWSEYGYNNRSKVLVLRGKSLRKNKIHEHDALGNTLIINCNSINKQNISDIFSQIKKFKPEFIHAYPSALKVFTKLLISALKMNDFQLKIKAVFLGSEQLFDSDLSLFDTFFRTQIVNWYGHSESLVFAKRVGKQNVFRVSLEYGYIELVDSDNQVITEIGKTGRIIATGFDNKVMPLIRYDTGDEGQLLSFLGSDETVLEIKNISGRDKNYIYLKDKTQVTLTSIIFGEHHKEFEFIKEFQIEQSVLGIIQLKVVPLKNKTISDFESLKLKLENSVTKGNLKVDVSIVQNTKKTHRGKNILLRQHLKV